MFGEHKLIDESAIGLEATDTKFEAAKHRLNRNGTEMLEDLCTVENDAELYDEDCIKPDPYAFERVRDLLVRSQHYVRSVFPIGTIYPDGGGALRVEWRHLNRVIILVVFSNPEDRHYIFHKEGDSYDGEYTVTPENLGYYLDWLNRDERTAQGC